MDITEIPKQLIKNEDYRYLLCIIDQFSKLAQCYILKNKNAESVMGNVKNFVNLYGKPNKIHTDNGKEFSNKLLEEYCRLHNIQYIHSRPYHPQSQGSIEKFKYNMEIKRILKNIYLENSKLFSLEINLPDSLEIYINNIHSSTKFKPIELFRTNDIDAFNLALENIKNSKKKI